jgi:hypothetical protein
MDFVFCKTQIGSFGWHEKIYALESLRLCQQAQQLQVLVLPVPVVLAGTTSTGTVLVPDYQYRY